MAARAEMDREKGQEAPICGARIAPILITHSIVLVVAVVWLVAIITG